jgi:hypothetical protein
MEGFKIQTSYQLDRLVIFTHDYVEQVRVSIVNAEDGGTFAARLADELGVGPGEVKLLFAEVFDTTPEARGAGVTQVGATLVVCTRAGWCT